MAKLLSMRETAEYLGLSYSTVRYMIKDGRIPAIKIGKQWRIQEDALSAMFEPSNIVKGDA